MAKMYGFSGRLTGKMGNAVFRVRKGEQVVSQYNPVVSNPKTEAQTEQRSKFKLMAQLGAVVGNNLGIRAEGNKTARNIFTNLNIDKVDYDEGIAKIELAGLQLTKSSIAFGSVSAARTDEYISVSISSPSAASFDGVRYVVLAQDAKDEFAVVDSTTVLKSVGGESFQYDFADIQGAVTVLAYAFTYTSERAKDKFENIYAPQVNNYAMINATRELLPSDIQFTKTSGAFVPVV